MARGRPRAVLLFPNQETSAGTINENSILKGFTGAAALRFPRMEGDP